MLKRLIINILPFLALGLCVSSELRAQAQDYKEGFGNIITIMESFDGKGNVSLMKLGRVAMTMGRTVGRAGSAWTRKVAKAFKKVDVVYMLDYGDSRPDIKETIEEEITRFLPEENLVSKRKSPDSFQKRIWLNATPKEGSLLMRLSERSQRMGNMSRTLSSSFTVSPP